MYKKIDLSEVLSVFVLTVGDDVNYAECLGRLESQSVAFRREIINRVAPMTAALQAMVDRCATPYFVQVDEDMLLYPHAIETLYKSLLATPPNTALICLGLWDVLLQMPIHGVKAYRHQIVKQFPYENSFSCEWTQVKRIRSAGYKVLQVCLDDRSSCLGDHGAHYTPRSVFCRFQRLAQKHRRYQHMQWLESWPKRLLERISHDQKELDVYAFLGLITGLTGELQPDREVDCRDPCGDFSCIERYLGSSALDASGR